jgi:hypothetical protein
LLAWKLLVVVHDNFRQTIAKDRTAYCPVTI